MVTFTRIHHHCYLQPPAYQYNTFEERHLKILVAVFSSSVYWCSCRVNPTYRISTVTRALSRGGHWGLSQTGIPLQKKKAKNRNKIALNQRKNAERNDQNRKFTNLKPLTLDTDKTKYILDLESVPISTRVLNTFDT